MAIVGRAGTSAPYGPKDRFASTYSRLRSSNSRRPPLHLRRAIGVSIWIAAAASSAETLYLPAAASVVGVSPFYSDVRAFNTSYTDTLTVAATYRCFIGSCSGPPQVFTLAPRESRAFDDVCVSLFGAPNSAGAIELSQTGADGALVVTSRLYATSPVPTVGMFVPALPISAAHAISVLTSVRNGGAGAGFRTNVGVYNPGDAAVTPVVRVYDGGTLLGQTGLDAPLGAHAGAQINDVFARIGAAAHATGNAVVVVDSGGAQALFSYAAVIDNATADPILVPGAADQSPPGSQQVVISVHAWDFSPGGPVSPPLHLQAGTTYTLVFHDVDAPGTPNPQHGFSGISELGIPPTDDISAGHDFVVPAFTPQPYQRGTYPFSCTRNDCGGDPEQHAGMRGTIIVE